MGVTNQLLTGMILQVAGEIHQRIQAPKMDVIAEYLMFGCF